MPKVNKKYYTLRKVSLAEKPRKTRAKNLEQARLQVMRNYDELQKLIKKITPKVDAYNNRLEARFKEKLNVAAKKAKNKGIQLKWTERQKMETDRDFKWRFAYKEAYLTLLENYQSLIVPCEPDIDSISPTSIRPGGSIELRGTCFGRSQGKVLLKITANDIVELEVATWNKNYILGRLNSLIANTPLRPYYGEVWIQTGSGLTSNVWPIMYYPIYSVYIASWIKHVGGGLWGASKDGTFLKDRTLADPDFIIEWVERHHWGDGWSEKRYPNAAGRNMAQGWHIGVDAGKHAYMKLLYRVKGPKGIDPPYFSDLGPWGWLGDYW